MRISNRRNVHQVFLLDLTADYGVKTNAKLTLNRQLPERDQNLSEHNFCVEFPAVYSVMYNFFFFGTIDTYPLVLMYFICLMDGRDSNSKKIFLKELFESITSDMIIDIYNFSTHICNTIHFISIFKMNMHTTKGEVSILGKFSTFLLRS